MTHPTTPSSKSPPLNVSETLEELVARAVDGNAEALDALLRHIKDDIYGLALRMLWHPADAEDATQEVLLRIVTQLSTFEGRSAFRTWAYRVAVRSILNTRRSRGEHGLSFEEYGTDLLNDLEPHAPKELAEAERALLQREVRIACTHAMLLCLDRDHRIAYLLGEVFEWSSPEAAACLEVSEPTYRKRLSRARKRVHAATRSHCSLVRDEAPCKCAGRIGPARRQGRIDVKRLLFATHPVVDAGQEEARLVAEVLAATCNGSELMRATPGYAAPTRVLEGLSSLRSRSRAEE